MDPVVAKKNMKVRLDRRDNIEMMNEIMKKTWPQQARQHVTNCKGDDKGHGSCLGATCEKGEVRLGNLTSGYKDLVMYLNAMLKK